MYLGLLVVIRLLTPYLQTLLALGDSQKYITIPSRYNIEYSIWFPREY
jgi:hypothetical protein